MNNLLRQKEIFFLDIPLCLNIVSQIRFCLFFPFSIVIFLLCLRKCVHRHVQIIMSKLQKMSNTQLNFLQEERYIKFLDKGMYFFFPNKMFHEDFIFNLWTFFHIKIIKIVTEMSCHLFLKESEIHYVILFSSENFSCSTNNICLIYMKLSFIV